MLVAICGPIASGKSTLARAVAALLEEDGAVTATLDLDLVYEMLDHARAPKSDEGTWRRARRLAGVIAAAMLQDEVDVVVTDGDYLDERGRAELEAALPTVTARYVTLTVGLPIALERVAQDPTRGLSRDPAFLEQHYRAVDDAVRTRPPGDLCLDTGRVTVEAAAQTIVTWLNAKGV